ncbi:MAG: hypothetical protein JRJ66_02840 [Deltaproteobacteria bacterium]|nr:hypothetical protein [Deltaproteobacteria bacterium]
MTQVKESLDSIQAGLEASLKELKRVRKVVESMEKAMGGFFAPAKAPRARPRKRVKPSAKGKPSGKRGTATVAVLDIIEKSKEPVSLDEIKNETRFDQKKIYGILNRAKKQGKIKSPKRGVYVMV